MTDQQITIYHSPDSDDAFMFYGLTSGAVKIPGFDFRHDFFDIETLSRRALSGDIDCTAISVHALPYLKGSYAVLDCGASMGEAEYGPCLVGRSKVELTKGRRYKIALPGEYTSTSLAMKLYLAMEGIDAELEYIFFDQIQDAVREGRVDLGAIIHEGQLTYPKSGLEVSLDLGQWWWKRYALPLPLGINVVHKRLGETAMKAAAKALLTSIQYSMNHRPEAVKYALTYGRGITSEEADKFIGMYVNDRTLSLGEEGRKSIERFLQLGADYGFLPAVGDIQYILP